MLLEFQFDHSQPDWPHRQSQWVLHQYLHQPHHPFKPLVTWPVPKGKDRELKVHTLTHWKSSWMLICRLHVDVHMHFLKLCHLITFQKDPYLHHPHHPYKPLVMWPRQKQKNRELKVHTLTHWKSIWMLICRLHVDVHMHFLKLCHLITFQKDPYLHHPHHPYKPLVMWPHQKQKPAAGASTLEVMADVHQRFDNVDSGEVEVLDSTQEGNQVTQFLHVYVYM